MLYRYDLLAIDKHSWCLQICKSYNFVESGIKLLRMPRILKTTRSSIVKIKHVCYRVLRETKGVWNSRRHSTAPSLQAGQPPTVQYRLCRWRWYNDNFEESPDRNSVRSSVVESNRGILWLIRSNNQSVQNPSDYV